MSIEPSPLAQAAAETFYKTLRESAKPINHEQLLVAWERVVETVLRQAREKE